MARERTCDKKNVLFYVVDKQILINAKLKSGKRSKIQNKTIKEEKVCSELQYHLSR
jgi:hypothetical protein